MSIVAQNLMEFELKAIGIYKNIKKFVTFYTLFSTRLCTSVRDVQGCMYQDYNMLS